MAKKLKIGIISIMEGYPWGGSEELWYEMALEAINQGHKVSINYKKWQDTPTKIQELKIKGCSIFYRNSKNIYPSFYKRVINKLIGKNEQPKRISGFEDFLSHHYDILFINEGAFGSIIHFPGLYNLLFEYKNTYSILSHQNQEHGCLNYEATELIRKIYQTAKTSLFVSKRNLELAQIFMCRDMPNAHVVKNPVNLIDTSIIPFPKSDRLLLACVGRLHCAQKGQDLLLRALAPLKETFDFKLSFYGSGEDEKYLKDLTKYLDLEKNVEFKGHEKDIRKIWKENQILVLPSHHEGMPLVVVEAMLCGRPCLVTDVAGHTEWIDDNTNGFIASSNNIIVLQKKIEDVLRLKHKWLKIGKQAHNHTLIMIAKNPGRELLKVLQL